MKNVHIITGGSSGIGLECAKSFKDGIVLITGRREQKLIEAVEELKSAGIEADFKQGDISSAESIKELFEYASSLGNIKTLVNSAGVSGIGVDAKLTFEIDLVGSENLVLGAKEYLKEGAVVILISSMMGHMVEPNPDRDRLLENPSEVGAIDQLVQMAQNDSSLAYNFSKRGVLLLVKKYAEEFGKKGVRIVSISPGIIMTDMAAKAAEEHPEQMNYMKMMTPAQRNGKPEDIVGAVEYLSSDKASFITGTDLLVDGGLTIRLPEIMAAYANQE